MKKLPILFILLFSVTLITVSCKKKEIVVSEKTTLQKLLGKWTIVSRVNNDHYSGSDHFTTINAKAGDYFEFKMDGNIDTVIQSVLSSNTYTITGNNSFKISGVELWTI